MKRILFAIFIVLTGQESLLSQPSKNEQNSGKVFYDISFENSKLSEKAKNNLPKESVIYFKNNLNKVEMNMPMGKTAFISDRQAGTGTMLMEMMGNKFSVKMNKEDLQKDLNSRMNGKPVIRLTTETKTIAGYTCKKAIVTIQTKEKEKTMDVWFTDQLKIKNSFNNEIEGIDGFLMEFQTSQNSMDMKMSARSIEFMDIPDSEFIIPDDYQPLDLDAVKKMSGQH